MLWRLYREFKQEALELLFAFVLMMVYYLLDIKCVIYSFTGIPCPTCNMTRALLSLLKGDIYAYSRLNIMAIPVSTVVVSEILISKHLKNKSALHICSVVILTLNLFYYVIRFKTLI